MKNQSSFYHSKRKLIPNREKKGKKQVRRGIPLVINNLGIFRRNRILLVEFDGEKRDRELDYVNVSAQRGRSDLNALVFI